MTFMNHLFAMHVNRHIDEDTIWAQYRFPEGKNRIISLCNIYTSNAFSHMNPLIGNLYNVGARYLYLQTTKMSIFLSFPCWVLDMNSGWIWSHWRSHVTIFGPIEKDIILGIYTHGPPLTNSDIFFHLSFLLTNVTEQWYNYSKNI